MSKTDHAAVKGVAAFIVAVVAVNVLLRVLPLPDLDLPSIDVPGWVRAVLKVKNWVILGIVALVLIGAAVDAISRGRKRDEQ